MNSGRTNRSWLSERILFGVIAVPSSLLAIMFVFNLQHHPGGFFVYGVPALASGTVALLCWWFVFRGHREESRGVMRVGCLGGFAVGGISFFLGFVGPMLLTPTAEQGPLLGIFVTGPLGFVVGTLGGVLIGKLKGPRAQAR